MMIIDPASRNWEMWGFVISTILIKEKLQMNEMVSEELEIITEPYPEVFLDAWVTKLNLKRRCTPPPD